MSDSTTNKELYFINTRSLEYLEIQFVPPSLNFKRNTDTQNVVIIGKNNPLYQYPAGEKLLVFELDFCAIEENRQDVKRRVDWLESLTYNEAYEEPPDTVKLVWGRMMKNQRWIVKNFDAKLDLFDKQYGWYPRQAYVNLTLGLDTRYNPVNKSDILNGR